MPGPPPRRPASTAGANASGASSRHPSLARPAAVHHASTGPCYTGGPGSARSTGVCTATAKRWKGHTAEAAPRLPARLHVEVVGYSARSEEHTSELQSLMRISYAVFCLKKNNHTQNKT